MGLWPASPQLDDDTGRRIAKAIEERADAVGRHVDERVAGAETAIAELETRVASQREAIDTTVSEASAAITARAAEAEASLTAARAQADAIVPQLQQRFESAEAARQQTYTETITRLTETSTAQVQQVKVDANADLTALKTELGALREALGSEKTRLDAVSTQQQQVFNDAQEQRTKEFAAQRDQAASAARAQREEQAARGEEQIAEMQRILEETQRVANAVATTGTATAYGKDAKDERRSADRWRLVAIVLGLSAAVFAAVTLVWHPPDASAISIISTTGRVGVTIALGAVATYAARQSGHHRRREERSRRIELELTVFTPFVEGLEGATKQTLRAEYAHRLFRGADDPTPAAEPVGEFQGQQVSPIGQAASLIADERPPSSRTPPARARDGGADDMDVDGSPRGECVALG